MTAKKILLAFGLWGLPALSFAAGVPWPNYGQYQEKAVPMIQTAEATDTCKGISISSITNSPTDISALNVPTSVAASSGAALVGARFVAIQNADSTYDINCNDSINVSTITSPTVNVNRGWDIPKSNGWGGWAIMPGTHWYCITQNPSGTSPATACNWR